jgi:PAT family beta-lactamase induction signal transducer AmpG
MRLAGYLSGSTSARLIALTLLYVAQGVPIGLLSIALPAWLVSQGLGAADIATLVAITGLPWGFKLVAGPFMDRFSFLPMGRRRPWVMIAQGGLTLAMGAMAFVTEPADHLGVLIAIGFAINAFAAFQDVAVDGMAIDLLPETERGRANAFMAFGQVAGFSAFGALNGVLLVQFGLPLTALISACAVAAVFVFITLVRERHGERLLPWTRGEASPRDMEVPGSFVEIFRDLLRVLLLPMSLVLVGVEFLGRASAGVAVSIFPVMAVQELGFTTEEYSYWIGIAAGASAVVGLAFGPLVDRFGAVRLMMVGLVTAALVAVGFALAQAHWDDALVVIAALLASQFASQLMFVAVIAAFMEICWPKVAATQFAIYMSLANLSRSIGAGAFALIADQVTTVQALYLMAGVLACGAVLLTRFNGSSHRARLAGLQQA